VRARTLYCWAFLLLSLTAAYSQTCPAYTHRDDVIAGSPGSLPQGWCLYAKSGVNGLFKTSLNSYSESIVTGTESHRPQSIEISPDGEWAVYVDMNTRGTGLGVGTNPIFVVKTSGGTPVNVPADWFMDPWCATSSTGFRRGMPGGALHIWYLSFRWANPGQWAQESYVGSIPVSFQTGSPVFGTSVKLADTRPYDVWLGSGAFSVYNDQVFGIFIYPNGMHMNGFLALPPSGVATSANMYAFSNPPAVDYWGCGQTMSHDGLFCASNSRYVGDSSCVPNQLSTPPMDHKGFYVTKFLRQGVDPAIAIDDQIQNPTYGRSINWCPTEYRRGTNEEVDFTEWNYTNDNTYIIGCVFGTRVSALSLSKGIWMVHTPDNTWTQLTPSGTATEYREPAAYFTGLSAGQRSIERDVRPGVQRALVSGGQVTLEPGVVGCAVYNLSGALVTTYVRRNAAGHETVSFRALTGFAPFVVAYWK
jgi:hypothetical protein